MLTRLFLALMWLLHWLPLPVLAWLGRALGAVLYAIVPERRRVTRINLRLCFPEKSEPEIRRIAWQHFMVFGRSFIELCLWRWASPARIRRIVKLEGAEKLAAYAGRPLIVLVPHFVGIDGGLVRIALERGLTAIYTRQKNRIFEASLTAGRQRFNGTLMVTRQEGTRKALKAMKEGRLFHYSPDQDYGAKDSLFVPFFGVPTATIPGLARLAKITGATVLSMVTRIEGKHYVASLGEPWADFPQDCAEGDTRRMNAFIEQEVLKAPEQYYWLHKRFKTRPPGEKGVY